MVAPSVRGSAKDLQLEVSENGSYEATFKDGRTSRKEVVALPAPETVEGPWAVTFQKERRAPEGEIPFDSLSSWTEHEKDGIRYFSGTADYRKTITIGPERLGDGRRVLLDLGEVNHLAEVVVNGKSLGVLLALPDGVSFTNDYDLLGGRMPP
jgi:hypothetical protein